MGAMGSRTQRAKWYGAYENYFGPRILSKGNVYKFWSRPLRANKADFGTSEMPLGEVNRYQRLNGDIQQAF